MFTPLIISAVLLFCILPAFSNSFAHESNHQPAVCLAEAEDPNSPEQKGWGEVADKINLLRIYGITDGEMRSVAFTKEDLKARPKLTMNGYVGGIVILGEEEMSIRVDGQQMSKIKKNVDGTFSLMHFGKLRPEEIFVSTSGRSYYEEPPHSMAVDQPKEEFLPAGYSLFPRVAGDSLSPQSQFDLVFDASGKVYTASIRQDGYHAVRTISLNPGDRKENVKFRYLGAQLQRLEQESADFEKRLEAIAQGVYSVESTFGMDLVENVNILDFGNVRNALACDDEDDIWFYVEAFEKEPFDELKSIAAHETLHIYVDKNNFVRDARIRELFANLKGYDELSLERFMVIMTGAVPPGNSEKNCEDCALFAFINESNFIEGMKGGHSHKSVEEFCTSFVHSLMFVDQLEQKLEQPVKFPGAAAQPRVLTPEEKASVLDTYVLTIKTLIEVLPEEDADATAFLDRSLKHALDVCAKQRSAI